MERRRFLVGLGSASVGGSALLGSGAFSRVDAQRSVTIQVAEDPDAYLGMDKCTIEGSETPNSSYAHLDEHGHLRLYMDDENPTIPTSDLGLGINSDSTTWFDNVFQICNQGKEDVCLWIQDSDSWPLVDSPEAEGERQVDFYLNGDPDASLVGAGNAIPLPLGECVCVGLVTRSYDLGAGDTALDALDDEITIVADVDADCGVTLPQCPFYGMTVNAEINSILGDPSGSVNETLVHALTDGSPSNPNYPNGLALDRAGPIWYFTEDDGTFKSIDSGGTVTTIGDITPGSNGVAGAAYWDATDEYVFIPQGGDTLLAADPSDASTRTLVSSLDWTGITLGDIAIDQASNTAYVSAVSSSHPDGSIFFEVTNLNGSPSQNLIASGDPSTQVTAKQIAFDDSGTLWAHATGSGDWFTADVSDGSATFVDTTGGYTDLARCGRVESPG